MYVITSVFPRAVNERRSLLKSLHKKCLSSWLARPKCIGKKQLVSNSHCPQLGVRDWMCTFPTTTTVQHQSHTRLVFFCPRMCFTRLHVDLGIFTGRRTICFVLLELNRLSVLIPKLQPTKVAVPERDATVTRARLVQLQISVSVQFHEAFVEFLLSFILRRILSKESGPLTSQVRPCDQPRVQCIFLRTYTFQCMHLRSHTRRSNEKRNKALQLRLRQPALLRNLHLIADGESLTHKHTHKRRVKLRGTRT